MKNTKIAALVAGALVAGLVLGGIGLAAAAPAPRTTPAVSSGTVMSGNASSVVTALAKLTGLTTDAVIAQHATGVSFATIATENGVDPADLVAQVVADRRVQLDALVAAGTITQAQEDALIAGLGARIQAVVDMTPGSGAGSTTTTPSVPATGPMGPRGHMNRGRHLGWQNHADHANHGMAARMAAHWAAAPAADPSSATGTAHRGMHASAGMGGSGTNMGSGRGRH